MVKILNTEVKTTDHELIYKLDFLSYKMKNLMSHLTAHCQKLDLDHLYADAPRKVIAMSGFY